MNTLFTTSNNPDVYLPAMNTNFFNCVLFVLFLLGSLYFLVSLMTANVFKKYMTRLARRKQRLLQNRMTHIAVVFARYDHSESQTLDVMQAKAFLREVLELDYQNELHRKRAHKILQTVAT